VKLACVVVVRDRGVFPEAFAKEKTRDGEEAGRRRPGR
jgi:hypothetical protein